MYNTEKNYDVDYFADDEIKNQKTNDDKKNYNVDYLYDPLYVPLYTKPELSQKLQSQKECPKNEVKYIYSYGNQTQNLPDEYHPSLNKLCDTEIQQYTTELLSNKSINETIDIVLNKKFVKKCFGDESIISNPPLKAGKKITDLKMELKSIMTDIVNDYFLNNQELMSSFLKIFVELMTKTLIEYCGKKGLVYETHILFIYKGGNTLKILIDKYLSSIPQNVREIVYQHYYEHFKKSDLDFQIIIHKDLPKEQFNQIHEELQIIAFLTLNKFRNILSLELDRFFNFHKLKKTELQKILSDGIKKLNESEIVTKKTEDFFRSNNGEKYLYLRNIKFTNLKFQNINVDDKIDDEYSKKINEKIYDNDPWEFNTNLLFNNKINSFRDDLLIRHINDNATKICSIDKLHNINENNLNSLIDTNVQKKIYKNNNSELYISLNEHIEFNVTDNLVLFSLIRMKVNFTACAITQDGQEKIMNIPGELIDVSITKYEDTKSKNIKNKIFANLYEKYKYEILSGTTKEKNKKQFEFWSYNLHSFINDLFIILFYDNILPWEDKKYEKRIYRVFLLMFVEMLLDLKFDNNNRNNFYKVVNDDIDRLIREIKYFNVYLNNNVFDNNTVFDNVTSMQIVNNMNDFILRMINVLNEMQTNLRKPNELSLVIFLHSLNNKMNFIFIKNTIYFKNPKTNFNKEFIDFNKVIIKNLELFKSIMTENINYYYGDKKITENNLKNVNILGGMKHKYMKYKSKIAKL